MQDLDKKCCIALGAWTQVDLQYENCIALGDKARACDHSYQLTVAYENGENQLTTEMTPEEFVIISTVLKRLKPRP